MEKRQEMIYTNLSRMEESYAGAKLEKNELDDLKDTVSWQTYLENRFAKGLHPSQKKYNYCLKTIKVQIQETDSGSDDYDYWWAYE